MKSGPRLTLALTSLMLAQLGLLCADCDYGWQYSHNGLCCDFCPPGHFVREHCSATRRTTCEPCPLSTYSEVTDNLDECKECRTCQQVTLKECSATLDANCSCHEGFLCSSLKCGSCLKQEICPRGHEMIKTGAYLYAYHCEPCAEGTYSDTEGGRCKVLTRCDQCGLATKFPGNKTHNSVCGVPDPSSEPDRSTLNTGALLLPILLLCVFTALAVLVKTCMMKSYKARPTTNATDLTVESLALHLSMEEEKGGCPIQAIDSSLTGKMTE